MTVKMEHCLFSWAIENFSFCPRGEGKHLRSPTFTLSSSSTTRWRAAVRSDGYDDQALVLVQLVRSEIDEGPEEVTADFRIDVTDSNRNFFIESTQKQVFRKGDVYSLQTLLLKDLLEVVTVDTHRKCKILTLHIEILVLGGSNSHQEDSVNTDFPSTDPNLEHLSRDLSALYSSRKYSDVVIITTDGHLEAHRGVIEARSLSLRYIAQTENVIDLRNIPLEMLDKMISHMYSGKFDFRKIDSSKILFLSQWMDEFAVNPLKDWLTPNLIYASTHIECEECGLTWCVEDFSLYENSALFLDSPRFDTGSPNPEVWFVRMLPGGSERSKDHVGVQFHVANLRRKVLVEVIVLAPTVLLTLESKLLWLESDSFVEFPFFIPKDLLTRSRSTYTPNDTLTVHCRVKLSNTDIHRNSIKKSCLFEETPNPRGNSLRVLSDDFFQFFNKEGSGDMTMDAGKSRFMVYKSIICSRSSYLAELCARGIVRGGGINKIPGAESAYVLKRLLQFLYSGRMDHSSPIAAVKLYLLSETMSLRGAQDSCSSYLLSRLDPHFVSAVYILARLTADSKLMLAALQYLQKHSDQVFATEEWNDMATEWKDLAQEIRAFLGCKQDKARS